MHNNNKEIKLMSDLESMETNLLEKISNLKLKNNYPHYHKNNYFATVQTIGQEFYLVFNNYQMIPKGNKRRLSLVNSCITNNIIDVFVETLTRLFGNDFDKEELVDIDNKVYKSIEIILSILMRCSEISSEFGTEICERDNLLSLFRQIIDSYKSKFLHETLNENQIKIMEYTITNLYNIVIYNSKFNIKKLQKLKILDIIDSCSKCENENIRVKLLLIGAFLADEDSNERYMLSLIRLLSNLLQTNNVNSQASSLEQLIKGIKKLSQNDGNKRRLVELDLLPLLKKILEKQSIKLKKTSLSVLWSLAMDEKNKKQITEMFQRDIFELENKGRDEIHNLKTEIVHKFSIGKQSSDSKDFDKEIKNRKGSIENENQYNYANTQENTESNIFEDVKCDKSDSHSKANRVPSFNLDGLLWTLQDRQKTKTKLHHETSLEDNKLNEKHFMISYCHEDEVIVLKIYEELKKKGFKLWIDKYDMGTCQNLMEAMAEAVEQCIAVIICVSDHYKNSDACRAEAQYAKTNSKNLIPIIIEESYRPKGWLGICVAGLQYYKIDGKNTFEESMSIIIETLLKLKDKQQNLDTNKIETQTKGDECEDRSKIHNWTNKDVSNWFHKIGIQKFVWKTHYTGSELEFLKTLSSEKFVEFCQEDLKMCDLKDIRILSDQLKKL